jgi:hypothetical protein
VRWLDKWWLRRNQSVAEQNTVNLLFRNILMDSNFLGMQLADKKYCRDFMFVNCSHLPTRNQFHMVALQYRARETIDNKVYKQGKRFEARNWNKNERVKGYNVQHKTTSVPASSA